MLHRRAALAAVIAPLASPALAQGSGPIRVIVPFPPGGSVDIVARLLQPHLQEAFGVPVVVDNRGGASGALGTAAAARAAPDGTTFVLVFDTHATNPALIPNMGFDARADLAPVWLLGTAPNVVAAHRSRPWADIGALLEAARAQPDRITYGTIGNGSLAHLGMVLAQRAGRFGLTHVPYRGGGPLVAAAASGETDLYAATGAVLSEQMRSGNLRPLAVLAPRRSPTLPEVPTMAEAGAPGAEAQAFWGMLAPARTQAATLTRMAEACRRATEVPEVRQRLVDIMGIELRNEGGEAFGRFLDGQFATWARVIRENDIRPD